MSSKVASHDDLFTDLRAARGEESDETWAHRYWMTLVIHGHVSPTAADGALREVLDLMRESGEGPEQLYGSANDSARERIAEWAGPESDVLHAGPAQWRNLPLVAAISAAILSLLVGVVEVAKGEWAINWTVGGVLLPFLGPMLGLIAITTWERVVAHHNIFAGAMSAAAIIVVGACGGGMLFALTSPHPLARASVGWCCPIAGAYVLLAWLLHRLLPRAVIHAPLNDDV